MRIAWVRTTPKSWRGGVRLCAEVAQRLAASTSFELILPSHSRLFEERGLKVRIGPLLPGDNLESLLFSPISVAYSSAGLRRILAEYDVVIASTPANLVAPLAHPRVLYYCYEPSQPIYDSSYIASLPRNQRIYWGLVRPTYSALDRVASKRVHTFMTLDSYTSREIRKVYRRDAVVVGEGIDPSVFKRTRDAELADAYRGRKVIFSLVKDLEWYNGANHLLMAFSKVVRELPEAMLVLGTTVVPPGRRQEVERLARYLGVERQVEILSFIPDRKLAAYYSLASVVAHPLFIHNSILMNKEAMACETPVVTWDGRARDDIGDSGCGFLVPEGSVEGLAEAILKVLRDPELAAKMGRAGRKRVVERFTVDLVARRILKLAETAVS